MNPHLVTLIKRGDVVLQSGVGALVRTRHGITGLVAGLQEWEYTMQSALKTNKDLQEYRRAHTIRERELEVATGVSSFLEPPRFEEDRHDNWVIPIIRFPLAGVCENWRCGRVFQANPYDTGAAMWKCPVCAAGKGFGRVRQVPIFRVCPAGHLAEIDWPSAVDHVGGCTSSDVRVSFGDHVTAPRVTCNDCGGKNESPVSSACTGTTPWLPGIAVNSCSEKMEIVERTSVKVYFPNMKSSLHVPPDEILDEALIEYLVSDALRLHAVRAFSVENDGDVADFQRMLGPLGFNLSAEDARLHIRHIHIRDEAPADDEEWDVIAAREREFDVLSGRLTFPALSQTSLLSFEVQPASSFFHPLIGKDSLITGVTAVHVLTETRVLNGFSRILPRSLTRRDGHLLMWGSENAGNSWLPAYRVLGEGIFVELNAPRLHEMLSGERPADDDSWRQFDLSLAGTFAHTFAHLLIRELGNDSGYSVPSIRDRIYDLGSDRLGLLVYTAEGDSMGTMGGVVAFAAPGPLERLLDRVCAAAQWCPQDPVCIEMPLDKARHIAGACHQCALVPETSCELFNLFLDRGTLIGSVERGFTDLLGRFLSQTLSSS